MPDNIIEKALTKEAAELLPRFSRFKEFYLVGGTALALQIGHRISVDFDFFTSKELSSNLLRQVKRTFPEYAISVTYQAPEQLNVLVNNIKSTFFQYEYEVIDDFIQYKDISMASMREIAAMKAFAIGKRLAYKDYIDWYFLIKDRHIDLKDVIRHAKKKFGGDFNDRLFLGQLVSFEDIPTQKIDFLDTEVSREMLEDFLKETVRTFQL